MGKNDFQIRNYKASDLDQVAQFNHILMLAYRYNGDFKSENIFCAVNTDGGLYAVGHIEPDQSWEAHPHNGIFKLNLAMTFNPKFYRSKKIEDKLLTTLLKRAVEIREHYPNKKIRLSYVLAYEDLEEMDRFLAKGFVVTSTHLIMKRDLTMTIPPVELSAPFNIVNWKMTTKKDQEHYLRAEAKGDQNGLSWSLNRLQWTKSGDDWATFVALKGDEVVGSVMTWGLGDMRSATENIFVVPECRRQGIAKALITEALTYLKNQGKTAATLGVYGDNKMAIALYESLGYRMMDMHIELGLDI